MNEEDRRLLYSQDRDADFQEGGAEVSEVGMSTPRVWPLDEVWASAFVAALHSAPSAIAGDPGFAVGYAIRQADGVVDLLVKVGPRDTSRQEVIS